MIDRLLYLLIAGGLGGLLGWLVSEPFIPGEVLPLDADTSVAPWRDLYARWVFAQNVLGLASGFFIGGLIGFAGGWAQGSRKQMRRGAIWGAVAGAISGGIALPIAAAVYRWAMSMEQAAEQAMLGGMVQLTARALGWGVFGLLVGAGQAVATRSFQRVRQAALGGLVGGTIGGVVFELVAPFTAAISQLAEPGRQEIGRFSRAAGLVCIGAGTGLFIGLAEMVLRSAWIRVLAGRNEGKEYLVDAATTAIGRSELADIPLYGDRSVESGHAYIQRAGNHFTLIDATGQPRTFVNGQPIRQTPLADGDVIQIGQFNLEFRLKAGRGVRPAQDVRRAPIPAAPLPSNVCPFCGEIKDAAGNCACTPSAQPTVQSPAAAEGFALVALDGPLAGQRFAIGASPVPIGREAHGGILLAYDPMVSRRHAVVVAHGSECVIEDQGSTNGTFVNGARVSRQVLAKGDTVTVGGANFRVE